MSLPATRTFGTLAAVLLMLGAVARIVGLLQNASLSGDEAMLALSIGRRSFSELLRPLDFSQIAPVPFLWAERLPTLLFGVSGPALRLVPLAAGIAVLWVVYRLAGTLGDRVEAVVALALAATAFPLIRYSVEVKPYIVDAFVGAGLILLAVRLVQNVGDRRRWIVLALSGAAGVLLSTPAILVCTALLAGLVAACLRANRSGLLPRLLVQGLAWAAISGLAYRRWYAPVADSPYIREFWTGALLRPGTAHIVRRFRLALEDTACTLTCWRGILDLAPVLLILAAVGVAQVWRRRGPEYAILLAGPLLAGFGVSMLGRYPVVTRLMLYSAPLLATMVALGMVAVARGVESFWPRVKARWVVLLFLYPSLVLGAVLTFTPPADWGVRGVEIRPLAEEFRRRGGGEPVYIFARAIPAWVFHTTDWSAPDTARLSWIARNGGPEGRAFVNGRSRGKRSLGEDSDLIYTRDGKTELFGTPSGSQGRVGVGYTPPHPDPGWAENEAWRMRSAARPYLWLVMSDFEHPPLDERGALLSAIKADGGEVVSTRGAPGAVLYRIRFGSRPASH